MIGRYKYINWKRNEPTNILEYMLSPTTWGLRIINFFFQKILRINAEVPFMVHFTSTVSKNIHLGKGVVRNFSNSGGCYIQGINGIFIGDDVIFAPGVKIISSNHIKGDFSKHERDGIPIIIGNRCWIGANSVILPRVILGDDVIVAAGAVVTKSFPSNVVIGGVPAKVIGLNTSEN